MSFEAEFRVVNKLHLKGKNLPVDISITEAFTQNLVSSIILILIFNLNALMCMTKIREKETKLIEHSLNVAILLTNFGAYLDLDKENPRVGFIRSFA